MHAPPATERQTASASCGQPASAAVNRYWIAARTEASTLTIAASHAASPSRALRPAAVSRVSRAGRHQATTSAVTEHQQCGLHSRPRPASRRTTVRSASDSAPSISATKWLSTTSASPPPASASRISRALYSSRLAVAV